MKTNQKTKISDFPLCVDLDGTLIKTDILLESLFVLLKQKLRSIVQIPFWFSKGKAHLKHQIANRVELDVSVLPYHDEFLALISPAEPGQISPCLRFTILQNKNNQTGISFRKSKNPVGPDVNQDTTEYEKDGRHC